MDLSSQLDGQRFDLNGPWLRFRDPEVERVFTRETFAKSINFIRAYLLAGMALYFVFGFLDLAVGDRDTPALLTIRYGVVCPILLIIFGLTFLKGFFRIGQWALATAMLSSGLGVVVMKPSASGPVQRPARCRHHHGRELYCGSLIRLKYSTAC